MRAAPSMDAQSPMSHLSNMASIMTIDEQRRAGAATHKAGGYDELIRLEAERRAFNGSGTLVRASDGQFSFKSGAKPDRKNSL